MGESARIDYRPYMTHEGTHLEEHHRQPKRAHSHLLIYLKKEKQILPLTDNVNEICIQ